MSVPRTDDTSAANANGQTSDTSGTAQGAVSPASEGSGSDWFREAFAERVGLRAGLHGDRENGGGTEPKQEPENGKQTAEAGVAEPSAKQDDPKPFRTFQTQEEFDRAVQSEKDRQLARERQRARTDEERRLLKEQPHEFARLKREELEAEEARAAWEKDPEYNKRISDFAQEQVLDYDKNVLSPLCARVADSAEKAALMGNIQPGIEGRGALSKSMLDLYAKQVRDEARRAFAEDPAFIKEILVKHGGQRAEPEVVSAVGAAPRREDSNQDEHMDDILTFGARSRGR